MKQAKNYAVRRDVKTAAAKFMVNSFDSPVLCPDGIGGAAAFL